MKLYPQTFILSHVLQKGDAAKSRHNSRRNLLFRVGL